MGHLRVGLVACGIVAVFASGCASTSITAGAMVAAPRVRTSQNPGTISVLVAGGQALPSEFIPRVSNDAFAQAVRESIEKSGLFSRALPGPGGTYRLQAFIGSIQQPFLGYSMTVTMEVSYSLIDGRTDKLVWERSIATEHTTPVTGAYAAATRVRLATEGAAAKNIEAMLAEVSKLKLD